MKKTIKTARAMMFCGVLTAAFDCQGMWILNSLKSPEITLNRFLSLLQIYCEQTSGGDYSSLGNLIRQDSDEAGGDVTPVYATTTADRPYNILENVTLTSSSDWRNVVCSIVSQGDMNILQLLVDRGVKFGPIELLAAIGVLGSFAKSDEASYSKRKAVTDLVLGHLSPDCINSTVPTILMTPDNDGKNFLEHSVEGTILDVVCETVAEYDLNHGITGFNRLVGMAWDLRSMGAQSGEELEFWAWSPEWGERREGDANLAWLDSAAPVHPRAYLYEHNRNRDREEGHGVVSDEWDYALSPSDESNHTPSL
ncbi:MAG: hypothetical protein LBF54_00240 [Holosporaceae bacterium]|jgi:hypothetical protein|nr:hypothetical protein [Holosporaceae bacterium]